MRASQSAKVLKDVLVAKQFPDSVELQQVLVGGIIAGDRSWIVDAPPADISSSSRCNWHHHQHLSVTFKKHFWTQPFKNREKVGNFSYLADHPPALPPVSEPLAQKNLLGENMEILG